MNPVLNVDGVEVPVDSSATLDAVILKLHNDNQNGPKLIQLVAQSGATMSLGVGAPVSILHYISPEGWPAYTACGTDPEALGTLSFTLCGELTELPAAFGVPFETAKAGFLDFFNRSERPDCFEWSED
ncbi:MAG TPA: Imm1 family immunity protein [Verrucomicrobiales bacterium]|jgi:hypothetical protein|nr:Imm1 family immunity protein [Verrucomicrobiales bacterium]